MVGQWPIPFGKQKILSIRIWKEFPFRIFSELKSIGRVHLQKKVDPSFTILEHWCLHVDSWFKLAKEDDNLLIISYEDLIDNSYSQYEKIHSKFFRNKSKRAKEKVDPIKKPIGLLPNMGTKDSWKGTFNAQDEVFFRNIVAENFKYATPNHSFV